MIYLNIRGYVTTTAAEQEQWIYKAHQTLGTDKMFKEEDSFYRIAYYIPYLYKLITSNKFIRAIAILDQVMEDIIELDKQPFTPAQIRSCEDRYLQNHHKYCPPIQVSLDDKPYATLMYRYAYAYLAGDRGDSTCGSDGIKSNEHAQEVIRTIRRLYPSMDKPVIREVQLESGRYVTVTDQIVVPDHDIPQDVEDETESYTEDNIQSEEDSLQIQDLDHGQDQEKEVCQAPTFSRYGNPYPSIVAVISNPSSIKELLPRNVPMRISLPAVDLYQLIKGFVDRNLVVQKRIPLCGFVMC